MGCVATNNRTLGGRLSKRAPARAHPPGVARRLRRSTRSRAGLARSAARPRQLRGRPCVAPRTQRAGCSIFPLLARDAASRSIVGARRALPVLQTRSGSTPMLACEISTRRASNTAAPTPTMRRASSDVPQTLWPHSPPFSKAVDPDQLFPSVRCESSRSASTICRVARHRHRHG